MKVLVTGASGNIGYHVANELISMGETVVVATSNIEKINKIFNQNNVEPVLLDFTDPNTFENALREVDRVFLLRPPHLGKPEDLYPFIQAMKEHNIKLVSFLSLMGVEKNTIPPHHKIEKYIEKLELPFAHVRPGFFMQNLSGIHSFEIREMDKIFIPAGKSKVSFIDGMDIGMATATILHNPNKHKNNSYTLTGSQSLDYFEIGEILTKILNRKITYSNPSIFKYRRDLIKKRGLDKKYVNVTVALYFMTRMGTAKDITSDFYELTGKEPNTFEDFAKRNRDCFIKRNK